MVIRVRLARVAAARSARDVVEAEWRSNRPMVGSYAEIGWDYLGLYRSSGLDGVSVGDVLVVDAGGIDEALGRASDGPGSAARRSLEEERAALLAPRATFSFWLSGGVGEPLPTRGEGIEITLQADGRGAWRVEGWDLGRARPAPPSADLSSVDARPGRASAARAGAAAAEEEGPSRLDLPLSLRLDPLVVAPLAVVWGT